MHSQTDQLLSIRNFCCGRFVFARIVQYSPFVFSFHVFCAVQMCQIMFETFKIPSLCVCVSAVLALRASGLTTGVVLDSGETITQAVPIYKGNGLMRRKFHL